MIIQGTKIENTKVFAADFVNNGLVLNLDARVGASNSQWNDVINNISFTGYNSPTKNNNYISFNADDNQYFEAPNTLGNLSQWTVESWFRTSGDISGYDYDKAIITTVYEYENQPALGVINYCLTNYDGVSSGANIMRAGFYNQNGGGWHLANPLNIVTNTWYHIVGTYDGVYLKQYNNGVYDNAGVYVNQPSLSLNADIRLGRRWDGTATSAYSFLGDISVVRVYNRALTDQEVYYNYQNSVNRYATPYRYWKFQLSANRGNAPVWQISEFVLQLAGIPVSMLSATASSPGGYYTAGIEDPQKAIDGNLATKFCCQNGVDYPLIIDMGSSIVADSYTWATGNDAPERDPSSWTVSVSNDGTNWTVLSTVNGFTAPSGRETYAGVIWQL